MQKGLPEELGTEDIKKLLIRFAIPSVIAMTASSLYNITDSIFIGHGVGALAISGLAITFPLMNLAAAFGSLVGAGSSTLMSLRLGQKDYQSANNILGNVLSLNLIIGIAYTIVILLFLDPILYFFGASENTISYARDYMVIISLGNVVTHLYFGLNALLRSIGLPSKAMFATICTVVINTIFAWFFVFVVKWGIKGAAIGTVLAQVIMLVWQLRFFSNKEMFIYIQWNTLKLKTKIVFDSLSIGLSPFLMNISGCIIIIVINQQLIKYGGDMAVGAYGIINRVASLFFMVVFGFNMGMQPIAGYNYGARQYDRVIKTLKITIVMATCVTTLGFLLSTCFPRAIASAFTDDETLINMSIPALRTVLLMYPIVGFQMVTANFFQSIGKPGKAIFLSLTRQVLILLPCLVVFPLYWSVEGVWYSFPAADALASIVSGLMLFYQFRKKNMN